MTDNRVDQILEQLKQKPEIVEKYNHAGIYSISIADKLVYIGKSANMLKRLAQHIAAMEYPKNHKYKVLKQAHDEGYTISFDVVYRAKCKNTEDMFDEIGRKEGEYIRAKKPPLNYQIPKEKDYHSYTVRKRAKVITLETILNKEYDPDFAF